MDKIINLYVNQRIDQILSIEKATSAENVEDVNVSKEFLELLTTSFELKTQCATTFLEKKDLIDTTESKIEMLFQNIITSDTKEKDAKFDDIIALAMTYYNIGLVYSGTKQLQDLVISEAHFTKCMTLLKGKELERKTIVTIIRVLHALHTISHIREEPENYSFLNTAMELYSKYTKEEPAYPNPINFVAILGISDVEDLNFKIILENLQLITLLRMSNLYQENCRDKHKFVIYVHNILNQLTERISCISSIYCVHWAITSSRLSQYFVHNYRFTEARNHLIAAEYMMKVFYEKEIKTINEKNDTELYKCLCGYNKTGYNSVIKSWGLYGTELLVASTNGLLQGEEDNKSFDTDNSESESAMNSKENLTKLLIFTDKEKNFGNFTARFPDKYVSNLNEAKTIFVDVLKCFEIVKKYFTIEEYFVDFADIGIATSKTYKCLATFEEDKERQIKLYIRQTDLLTNYYHQLDKIRFKNLENSLILFQMMTKISSEIIVTQTTVLNIATYYLLLNVEQTDKIFETKNLVDSIVTQYNYALKTFVLFEDKVNLF